MKTFKVTDKWGSPRLRDLTYLPRFALWYCSTLSDGDVLVDGQGLKLFQYTTLHVPTKNLTGPSSVVCYSDEDFLKLLEAWNVMDSWRYCAA